ncbi:6,7,8-trihydroxycoumarin synthase-like [Salvia hispanica]|uniref:6,7,8-trihydroxycoumarin synthase-like n=1 Tax=Salvia hispanica TaxID=49212 RepID=UPI00200969C3|nr:6,7,8-trihydroxycoumarin synthase-like [Salvia hispanica]
MMLLLISIALPIILFYLIHKRNNKSRKSNLPPLIQGLPLIGNLHQLSRAPLLHTYLSQLSNTHGPILRFNLCSTPTIVISSAKLAKEVLRNQDLAFCSRPKLVAQRRLSYNAADMVFAPYGAEWREQRRIANVHLLSPVKVQSFRSVREEEVARMVAEIARCASSSSPVDLSKAVMGLTTTLICRTGFGKRYEEQGTELRRFEDLLTELGTLLTAFFVSDYFPALSWVDRVSGLTKRLDCAFEKLDAFYQELIDDHLGRGRAQMDDQDHILGMQIKFELDSGKPNWDRVKALLMNLFLGGSDSSAATIAWVMTALMKEPRIMENVQSEIRNVVGDKGKVDEDDLLKLAYLKAVINETFRFYTPVPMLLARETTAACVLDGYEIPPKTTVYVNVWAVARDPDYWKLNPDEFLPERFIGNDMDVKGKDFGAIPFGAGRRICPGMSMGLANVELAVANLLYSFNWEMPPGVQLDTHVLPGLIMHKKNPLILIPKQYLI